MRSPVRLGRVGRPLNSVVRRLVCTHAEAVALVTAYTHLWEFMVEPEHVEEFQRYYGPQGSWVELFRRAPGYIQTLLLRDSTDRRHFVTIDRWQNAEAYHDFAPPSQSNTQTLIDAARDSPRGRPHLAASMSQPSNSRWSGA